MKINFLTIMATVVLCFGLMACGGRMTDKRSLIGEYCDFIAETLESERMLDDEVIEQVSEKLLNQAITTDIDGHANYKIIKPFRVMRFNIEDGTIDLEAIIKTDESLLSINQIIACCGDEPVRLLKYKFLDRTEEGTPVLITLNAKTAIRRGEEAKQQLSSINHIVFRGDDSTLGYGLVDYVHFSDIAQNGVFGDFTAFADYYADKLYKAEAEQFWDLEQELKDSLRRIMPTIVGNTIPTEAMSETEVRVIEPFTIVEAKIPEESGYTSPYYNQYAYIKLKSYIDFHDEASYDNVIAYIRDTPILRFITSTVDGVYRKPKGDEEIGDCYITIFVHPEQMGKALSRIERLVFTKGWSELEILNNSVFEPMGRKGFGGDLHKKFTFYDSKQIR